MGAKPGGYVAYHGLVCGITGVEIFRTYHFCNNLKRVRYIILLQLLTIQSRMRSSSACWLNLLALVQREPF